MAPRPPPRFDFGVGGQQHSIAGRSGVAASGRGARRRRLAAAAGLRARVERSASVLRARHQRVGRNDGAGPLCGGRRYRHRRRVGGRSARPADGARRRQCAGPYRQRRARAPRAISCVAIMRYATRGRLFLDTLYRPADAFRLPDGDTPACRCEEVPAADIIELARGGCAGPNQMKALVRCGMGACQGRWCGLTVTELDRARAASRSGRGRVIPAALSDQADTAVRSRVAGEHAGGGGLRGALAALGICISSAARRCCDAQAQACRLSAWLERYSSVASQYTSTVNFVFRISYRVYTMRSGRDAFELE